MIDQATNERLTRIGPGTSMGKLLRCYWHPVAAVAQLPGPGTLRVRLLGEDLVLFRDRSGNLGLLEARCPHRGASLGHAIPDPRGIRCPYHGWLFDSGGVCLERPTDPDTKISARSHARAHLVTEIGGLYFAYLGEQPAPLPPRWDLFAWKGVKRTIRYVSLPCNWLQIVENSLDAVHVEWLHGHFYNYMVAEKRGGPPLSIRRHTRLLFERFEHGIRKRRVVEGQPEDGEDWTIGAHLLFPTIWRMGQKARYEYHIRVPQDDTHTLHIVYSCEPLDVRGEEAQGRESIEVGEVEIFDQQGEYRFDTFDGQDAMVWVSQGPIADRTREQLGEADRGIVLYRKLLLEQLDRVERGQDPICVFRDPERMLVEFPRRTSKFGTLVSRGEIFHMLPARRWEAVRGEGFYESTSYRREGVIHCSNADEEQLLRHANDCYRDSGEEWVVLVLDLGKIAAEVFWQYRTNGVMYPHIYGRLNLDAVTKALAFPRAEDGRFLPFLAQAREARAPAPAAGEREARL